MSGSKVVHHAEVVGSLLRPPELIEARKAMRAGNMPHPEYRAIEDKAVDEALKLQEDVGLEVLTDGEMRRDIYFGWWISGLEGMSNIPSRKVRFRSKDGSIVHEAQLPYTVTDRLKAKACPGLDEFAYANSKTDKQVKITLPSPLMLMFNFWNDASKKAYPDPWSLVDEARDILIVWMKELADAGCTYLQVDTPELADVPEESFEERGLDSEEFRVRGTEIIGSLASFELPGVTRCMHVCKGNGTQSFIGDGDYSSFTEKVFDKAGDFDIYHLEYDDERSGDFEPLAKLPDDRIVLLGLVSTKWTEIEDKAMLKGRIEEASKYHPKENLGISTQCGFASAAETAEGRKITPQTQVDKLKLIVDVATDVWD